MIEYHEFDTALLPQAPAFTRNTGMADEAANAFYRVLGLK